MITTKILLERGNKWLSEKGKVLLNPQETIYLLEKLAVVVDCRTGVDVVKFEQDLIISFAINFIRLRKLWSLPKVLTWRGRVIKPSTIQ